MKSPNIEHAFYLPCELVLTFSTITQGLFYSGGKKGWRRETKKPHMGHPTLRYIFVFLPLPFSPHPTKIDKPKNKWQLHDQCNQRTRKVLNHSPLFLSSTKERTPLSNISFIAFCKFCNEFMSIGNPSSIFNIRHVDLSCQIPIANIFSNSS